MVRSIAWMFHGVGFLQNCTPLINNKEQLLLICKYLKWWINIAILPDLIRASVATSLIDATVTINLHHLWLCKSNSRSVWAMKRFATTWYYLTVSQIKMVNPVHPVTEGQSVGLGCKLRTGTSDSNIFFYRNGYLIQNDRRGAEYCCSVKVRRRLSGNTQEMCHHICFFKTSFFRSYVTIWDKKRLSNTYLIQIL